MKPPEDSGGWQDLGCRRLMPSPRDDEPLACIALLATKLWDLKNIFLHFWIRPHLDALLIECRLSEDESREQVESTFRLLQTVRLVPGHCFEAWLQDYRQTAVVFPYN